MSVLKIAWIVCAGIWAFVILGFVGVTVFNRIRNRDKHDMQ